MSHQPAPVAPAPSPTGSPQPPPATLFKVIGYTSLAACLTVLGFAVAAWVATSRAMDAPEVSSTSSIGFAIAIVIAVPGVLAGVLIGVGLAIRRRTRAGANALVALGAMLIWPVLALIAAQLIWGS